MSLSLVKPYFKTRIESLGFREHGKPTFNDIPENKLNKSFHLEVSDISQTKIDQGSIELRANVIVRAFFKASHNEMAVDKAISATDDILDECLAGTNRLNISGVKTVSFSSANIDLIESTHLDAMLTMRFTALVIKET